MRHTRENLAYILRTGTLTVPTADEESFSQTVLGDRVMDVQESFPGVGGRQSSRACLVPNKEQEQTR